MKLPHPNPWHVLAALAAVTFLACSGGGTSNPGPPPPPSTAPQAEATLAAFNQLEQGMTYDQVTVLFKGQGTLSSSSGPLQTYTFRGDSWGSSAIVTFTEGKVSAFTQMGLR